MPRAAFTYKSKDELRQMSLLEINAYIATLRRRAGAIGGYVRKSAEKELAVAMKVRESIITKVTVGDV